jgi:hypothetical protein
LLAGAFKFDKAHTQVIPHKLLGYFQSYLNYVRRLICIGYGFGDIHINNVLRSWLEFARDREIEIVRPGAKCIPDFLLHLSPQVTVANSTASDYLEQYAINPLSIEEKAEKERLLSAREAMRRARGFG